MRMPLNEPYAFKCPMHMAAAGSAYTALQDALSSVNLRAAAFSFPPSNSSTVGTLLECKALGLALGDKDAAGKRQRLAVIEGARH